jgi:uncharacterized alkaline shock family protein YloU
LGLYVSKKRGLTMNESTIGYQEAPDSGEPLRSDRDRTIVSDVVIAKIAGIAAQDIEGVRMGGSGAASNVGSFVDSVGWDGQPRDVSVRVVEKETEIDLTMSVEYGRAIPQIIEEVRRNVVSRVENQVGYGVAKANITVKDVLVPEAGSRLGLQPEGEQTAKVEDEEQNSAPSSRARSSSSSSSSTSSHLGPGGTYLDFWTESLVQYQQMSKALLPPYTGRPRQPEQEEKEV